MPYTHQGPRLYLAADRMTVVQEGDERAAFLLIGPGGQMSDEDARRYGLIQGDIETAAAVPYGEPIDGQGLEPAKAAPPKPNKVRTPRENKA